MMNKDEFPNYFDFVSTKLKELKQNISLIEEYISVDIVLDDLVPLLSSSDSTIKSILETVTTRTLVFIEENNYSDDLLEEK